MVLFTTPLPDVKCSFGVGEKLSEARLWCSSSLTFWNFLGGEHPHTLGTPDAPLGCLKLRILEVFIIMEDFQREKDIKIH